MNTTTALIPVFTAIVADEHVQLCNARELHSTLQVGKIFAAWIKERIEQYGFVEGEDFILCFPNLESKKGRGGHNRTDYHLTLDMAKELAMVENNEIGREIRRYLIRLEKKAIAAGLKVEAVVTRAQIGELSTLMAERFPVGKDRPYAWSRFNNHFRLAGYKDLPAEKFSEACDYIQQMQAKNGEYLPRDEHTSLNQVVAKWVKQIEAGNGTPIEVFEPLVKAVLKKRPSAGHEAMESLILDLLCKQRFSLSFIPLEHGLLKPQIHTHHVNAQTLVPQAVINDVRDRSFNFFPDALIPDLINAIGDRMAGANRSAV